jgi:hypothetical protein
VWCSCLDYKPVGRDGRLDLSGFRPPLSHQTYQTEQGAESRWAKSPIPQARESLTHCDTERKPYTGNPVNWIATATTRPRLSISVLYFHLRLEAGDSG